jgi:3-hydroxyisobutyrate dehydrogenase-like beta-hydroxyacid dehydrogenase
MAVKSRVGVIGLGLLGMALAERLRDAGFDLTGFDIDAERRALATDQEITVSQDAVSAVWGAEVVITCLPDGGFVRSLLLDEGLIDALLLGAIVIDCSTCAPSESRSLAEALEASGVDFLDAPISGNSAQVRRGESMLLIGGEAAIVKHCERFLKALSPKWRHLGPIGAGSTAKLVSNLVLGLNRLVLAEGMALGERAGLDTALLLETLRDSPAYSAAMDVKGERMVQRRYTDPDARLRQHEKDVRLILGLAEELGMDLPLSRVHLELLGKATEMGFGEADNAAVLELLRQSNPYLTPDPDPKP